MTDIVIVTPEKSLFKDCFINLVEDWILMWTHTEHVLQTDDTGEIVIKVDVVVVVSKPQADELQEPVVQIHAFSGTKQRSGYRLDLCANN